MNSDFPAETRLRKAVGEARGSSAVQVLHECYEPAGGLALDVDVMFETLEEVGYPLHAKLRDGYLSCRNMALQWHLRKHGAELTGEFDVKSITVCPELPLTIEDFIRDESQRLFLAELHVLDEMPRGGSGRLATIRLRGEPDEDPEIWFLDRDREFRLELDYCDYLANLAITKGASGWQYLFADVPLGDHEFGYVRKKIETMLEVFPEIFPGHDYAPLHRRLQERL